MLWFFRNKKTAHSYKITLEEENKSSKLPIEYSTRKVISKGFKDITINDFPLRGSKITSKNMENRWSKKNILEMIYRSHFME